MFLRWAKGEGIIEKQDKDDDKAYPERKRQRNDEDDDDKAEPERKRQRNDEDVEVRCSRTCGYQVAKIPGYGFMTVETLVDKFPALDEYFLWYLEEFLLAHSLPIPPSHDVLFGVFKRLSVMLPQIPQVTDVTDLRDTIRTILPEPPQD
jgi:hypothetical protein